MIKTPKELYNLNIPSLDKIYNKLGKERKQRTKYGKSVMGHIAMKQTNYTRNADYALTKVPPWVINMYPNGDYLKRKSTDLNSVFTGENLTPYGARKLKSARQQSKK